MSTIKIQEIEKDLDTFLRRVEAGEAFILFRDDQPIAEIKPVSIERKQRPFGLTASLFQVPKDFNERLADDILQKNEG